MRHSGFMFSQVPRVDIPRSAFNRNHGYKTTFDSGYLIPFYVDEALPGDTFHLNCSAFARMATPIVPIMDNLYLDMFFFAVPNRLVWNNWQKFCGEQVDPGDSIDYVVPTLQGIGVAGYDEGSLMDYMGIPTKVDFNDTINALHFRAYNLIWNEFFRDQNLQDSVPVPKDDGPDFNSDYVLLRRGKRHDYFTSCLPWPQKGPGVEIPIFGADGGYVPVVSGGNGVLGEPTFFGSVTSGGTVGPLASSAGSANVTIAPTSLEGNLRWSDPKLRANLAGVTAGTINDLRQAFQIQRLLERDARGGTRYIELLKAHFGVTSPDARLQRPEYLGGSSVPVSINPVAQTSASAATPTPPGGAASPQANLAAFGVVGGKGGFSKSFVEHTLLIGLVMVRGDLSYQQGINRMWSRRTRYDYYWPVLSHLGEQAVFMREINTSGTGGDNVFGYQERWAEYRYHPSIITGKFRSNATGSLDYWHLGQELSNPQLNGIFIQEDPPVDRVIAVPSEPQFLLDASFSVKCVRPMPLYSVPGMADHF